MCSNDVFLSWYIDELKTGKIRAIPHGVLSEKIKKDLQKLGFPLQSKDIHYIECAYFTDKTKYIVSVNFDFYEPTCFSATKSYKNRVREKREGSLCKYLKRNLGITVGMVEHCSCDLGMNLGKIETES